MDNLYTMDGSRGPTVYLKDTDNLWTPNNGQKA